MEQTDKGSAKMSPTLHRMTRRSVILTLPALLAGASLARAQPAGGMKGGMGGGIDKSQDAALQAMIQGTAPRFQQFEYRDEETGLTVPYNLYIPEASDTPLPLVYFIADSSVVGRDTAAPLEQGWGGLVWATEAAQAENPAWVLVPEFPEVILDDHGAYTTTDYVDLSARLLKSVAAERGADMGRLYGTGQSMGCMTMMIISARNPDLFAALLFVSGQWDTAELAPLAGQRFFYIAAEGDARASAGQDALAELLTGQGVPITRAIWDATWPREEMTAAVDRMLAQGTAVNFARFAKGTVMPEGVAAPAGSGEHMYSFDPAYRVDALRAWLFQQSK